MAKQQADLVTAATIEQRAAAVREQFLMMADLIPDQESDGGLAILEQIAGAGTVDALDDPWNARDALSICDIPVVINYVVKKESDFKDGIGIYLLIDYTNLETGETSKVTTGSASIVAQCVKAYTLDAYPLSCVVRKAKRQTKDGYWPQHLEMLDKPAPAVAAG